MAIDLENDSAVVLKPSTSTGPGETTGKGRAAATCNADAHRSDEVPLGNIQPVPTVLGNTQDARMTPFLVQRTLLLMRLIS